MEQSCPPLADKKQEEEWENKWGLNITFRNVYPKTFHLDLPPKGSNVHHHQMLSNQPVSHDLQRHLIFKQQQEIASPLWRLSCQVLHYFSLFVSIWITSIVATALLVIVSILLVEKLRLGYTSETCYTSIFNTKILIVFYQRQKHCLCEKN